jgi:hypothetical protein
MVDGGCMVDGECRLGQNYKANMAKLQSELQNMPLQGFHT